MSFLSIFKTIEADVAAGTAIAARLVGPFDPPASLILTGISELALVLEGQAAANPVAPKPDPAHVSTLVQSVAATATVKAAAQAVLAPVSIQIVKGQTVTVGA